VMTRNTEHFKARACCFSIRGPTRPSNSCALSRAATRARPASSDGSSFSRFCDFAQPASSRTLTFAITRGRVPLPLGHASSVSCSRV
jgi:hypothetical protein